MNEEVRPGASLCGTCDGLRKVRLVRSCFSQLSAVPLFLSRCSRERKAHGLIICYCPPPESKVERFFFCFTSSLLLCNDATAFSAASLTVLVLLYRGVNWVWQGMAAAMPWFQGGETYKTQGRLLLKANS